MANFSLQGHAALITGSSTGIGQGIAAAMREAGARVILHGMDEKAQREDLQTQPYCQVDLLAEGGCEKLLNDAFTHEPSLDLLVCNVGGFFDVPFLDMSKKIWDKTMRLNVESAYFLIQEFSRRLVAQGRKGSVVITSSTNGFQAEFDSTAYDTSKGALVMMTRSIALSLAEHGIRVNGLAPGFIRTPLTSAGLAAVPGLQETLEKKIAMGHIGEADDCAGAAVFLSSPAASYITGHVLIVDGGLSIGQLPRIG